MKTPKHEQPFWKMDADGYSIFGHYHNHDDWCQMRNRIVDGIVDLKLARPTRILDVGCGKGWNIQEIADAVMARTRHRPVIDIVEPDFYARNITESILIPLESSGFLNKSFSGIDDIKSPG